MAGILQGRSRMRRRLPATAKEGRHVSLGGAGVRYGGRSVRNFQFLHYDEIYQGFPEAGRQPVRFG